MIDVGLIVNPVAGVGGAVALKGSDGSDLQALAVSLGGKPRAATRTARTLRKLAAASAGGAIAWHTWDGEMGARLLRDCGIEPSVWGAAQGASSARDTRLAAQTLLRHGVELLVFAGGDGTARDVFEAVGTSLPVLGIPAGVKMHSGVFATTPEVAAEVLERLLSGGLVRATRADVRDWNTHGADSAVVRPQFYGELLVPELGGFIQHTKEAGRESEALAVTEITAQLKEVVADYPGPWVLGPGSTLAAIKTALGMRATLLGVDVMDQGIQVGEDVGAAWLEENAAESARLVLSFTRGQGFLIGRGNQQLSPTFLRRIGRPAITVVGTRTKLLSLAGRPLLVDTDDSALDQELTGLIEIIAGYEDRLLYQVATHA